MGKLYDKRSKRMKKKVNDKSVNVVEQLASRREVTEEEGRVIKSKEEEKARLIKLRRCPICKNADMEGNYIYNPNMLMYVCRECGGLFMDVKMVKRIYEQSMDTPKGREAKKLMDQV